MKKCSTRYLSRRLQIVSLIVFITSQHSAFSAEKVIEKNVENAAEIQSSQNDWKPIAHTYETVEFAPLYSFPHSRGSENIELVPGAISTQQYGAGTAGHYYLRGQNIQHGTGFNASIEGMPLSIRHHPLGQSYTDFNIIIPELLQSLDYSKGPSAQGHYTASATGAADFSYAEKLDKSIIQLDLGQDLYFRSIAATSEDSMGGKILYAADVSTYDGPWKNMPEDEERLTSFFKQSWDEGNDTYGFSIFAYRNNWHLPTQIPLRAVNSGSLDELHVIDASDMGKSRLVGITGNWQTKTANTSSSLNAYLNSSEFKFYSNNTYFLKDPTDGDQHHQMDKRNSYGLNGEYSVNSLLGTKPITSALGFSTQYNVVGESSLSTAKQHSPVTTIFNNKLHDIAAAVYQKNKLIITHDFMGFLNLRYDYMNVDTDSSVVENSNNSSDGIISGDFALNYKLSKALLVNARLGKGFINNHVYDVNNSIDPVTLNPVSRKQQFIDVMSKELSLQYRNTIGSQYKLTVWETQSDAEMVFNAETNTTRSTRDSKKTGIELLLKHQQTPILSVELNASFIDAKYTENAPITGGKNIPGIPDYTFNLAFNYSPRQGYFGTINTKYIGSRPLNEAATIEADKMMVTNLRFGRRWKDLVIHADILNLFNSDDHEVSYLYTSQLSNETAGVEDIHYRVLEPISYRIFLTHDFY